MACSIFLAAKTYRFPSDAEFATIFMMGSAPDAGLQASTLCN
jgi:hypothetical protein